MAATTNAFTARRSETRRKPKSEARGRPWRNAKYSAAATKLRSKATSPMMLTAGVGCDRLEPPSVATTSTMIVATTPNARPTTIAAGALHRRHGGWSSATCGGSGVSIASGGGAGGDGDGGGTLDMRPERLGPSATVALLHWRPAQGCEENVGSELREARPDWRSSAHRRVRSRGWGPTARSAPWSRHPRACRDRKSARL